MGRGSKMFQIKKLGPDWVNQVQVSLGSCDFPAPRKSAAGPVLLISHQAAVGLQAFRLKPEQFVGMLPFVLAAEGRIRASRMDPGLLFCRDFESKWSKSAVTCRCR